MKPLRSLLFVPGHRTDFLDKADRYGADALIIDLEDAVPDDIKQRGRETAASWLAQRPQGKAPVFARISAFDTPYTETDVQHIVSPALHAVVLAKTEGPEHVLRLEEMLARWEERKGLPIGHTRIAPLLETALGMVRTFDICRSSKRVETIFAAGISRDGDGNRTVGYQWTRQGLERLHLRSRILLEARAAGIANPICGTWIDIEDKQGLREEMAFARQLGYRGYFCIHPSHVAAANELFGISPQELEDAHAVIAAMQEAQTRGLAAIRHKGAMIDVANLTTARLTIETAKSYQ